MVDNRKEKYITSHEPVSLKQTEKIIEQMKSNSICRINNKGTGFFTKIPYKSKLLPVLITTNQVINTDDIRNKINVSLYINNDKIIKLIKITIIEIKEDEDNLNNKYLELNDEIINYFKLDIKYRPKYLHILYNNESIYLLHHPGVKDIFVSYGKLLDINNKKIIHNCNIKEGSSGSPILLLNNHKLIGIHCSSLNHQKYNKGILLIYSLIEFSKIKNNLFIIDKEGINITYNFIIAELYVIEDDQKIRIINSYEQSNRNIKKRMKMKKK